MAGAGARPFVDKMIAQRKVMVFSKSYVPECKMLKAAFEEYQITPGALEITDIEKRQDVNQIENYFQILCLTDSRAVPQLFVKGKYIGGFDKVMRMHKNGQLRDVLQEAGVLAS